jgi:hypothetical protein
MLLEACIWVRKLYNKEVINDLADTYHHQWMVNLKFSTTSVLSAMIMPNSTFVNVLTIVCSGVEPAIRDGGFENTAPHFNEERLTNVNFNVERTALARSPPPRCAKQM